MLKSKIRLWFVFVVFVALVATNGLFAAEKTVSIEKSEMLASYTLGAGDKVKITVFNEKELSRIYAINEKGILSMPLIGEVQVLGLTVFDVKKILIKKFSAGYLKDPSIAIEVDEFRPVYVVGEVRSPGSYEYVADMTILKAVAIAGGFTYRADKDEVEVLRVTAGESKLLEDMQTGENVRPGDIILIKERFF